MKKSKYIKVIKKRLKEENLDKMELFTFIDKKYPKESKSIVIEVDNENEFFILFTVIEEAVQKFLPKNKIIFKEDTKIKKTIEETKDQWVQYDMPNGNEFKIILKSENIYKSKKLY